MVEKLPIDESDACGSIVGTRIASIDALRGFDMFWIIGGGAVFTSLAKMWENPVTGEILRQLEHSKWEGFHFFDLIFPLFIFIVGVVLPFSLAKRRKRGEGLKKLYLHIVKRTVVLVLLGLIYNHFMRFDWPQMRWMGILQRIGLCYFFAALLVIHTKWQTQAVIAGLILVLYWAALALIPVPGYGAGVFTSEGCLPTYIDYLLIPGRLHYGFADPEGIVSTLPSISTVLLGVLAGHWLRSNRSGGYKAAGMALAGTACVTAGYIWGLWFPIIEHICWTSSFVLVAGGWSLLLLALFYWLIDVKGIKRWAFFFAVIGMNPITIFFLQRFVNFKEIARFFVLGLAEHTGILKPLVLALGVLTVKWLLLWFLYRRKIFFKA